MTGESREIAVEAEALARSFGNREALRGLSFALPPGGFYALLGRNGSGKSTLLRTLLGFVTPDSGTSRLLGADSRALPSAVRGRIAWVTEEHALPPWPSVEGLQRLQKAHFTARDETPWDDALCSRLLGRFRIDPAQRVGALSRGERAGLALALALAPGPELLLLDEPTLGLDAVAREAVLDAVFEAAEPGRTTVLYASHQMDEVERVADRLLVLREGALAAATTPEELARRIRCFWVEGPSPLDPGPTVPGLLRSRTVDGAREIFVLDPPEDLPERLRAQGAAAVREVPVGFDRAVAAFLEAGAET